MISPTIGRVVWYWPGTSDFGIDNGDQPLAALVTHVWSDSCVNLAVFGQDGTAHGRTSVRLVQDDSGNSGQPFAEWMPCQKGQAAKHDALEKKAAEA